MAHRGWPLWLAGTAGILLVPGSVAAAHAEIFCFQADVLGAPANFVITAPSRQAARLATSAALGEIARLDRLLSNYRADSELRRLNGTDAMAVSADLFAVLEKTEALRSQTGGAFSARMGAVEALWRNAAQEPPDAGQLRLAVARAGQTPRLDAATLTVSRPPGVVFSIDALAKGYIIDRALEAARRTGLPTGILIDIGGDMRCQGLAGSDRDWPVGLADARLPFVNAPLVAGIKLRDQAVATSGRGVRDRKIGDAVYSTTLSPDTGWPVQHILTANVVAPTAAQADGLATALLVMPAQEGLALAANASGVDARITGADGAVLTTPGWSALEAGPAPMRPQIAIRPLEMAKADTPPIGPSGWVIDWALQIFYAAPPIDIAARSEDFRSPYLAMWISDMQNHPVRTLALIGRDPEYQKDNHIWWSLYGERAPKLLELRSGATSLTGHYPTFWPGYDDNWKFVAPGTYLLNIETSRERGQHTFRAIPVKLGLNTFELTIPPTADMGEVTLAYGKQP